MNEDNDTQKTKLIERLKGNPVFGSTKLFLVIITGYAGAAIAVFSFMGYSFEILFRRFGVPTVGVSIFMVSMLLYREEMKKRKLVRDDSFIDVDERNKNDNWGYRSAEYKNIISELNDLKKSQSSTLPDLIEKIKDQIDNNVVGDPRQRLNDLTFIRYFDEIRKVLEQKSQISDEKASILLDKGMGYSKVGIVFFVISIVGWQVMSWTHGFQAQFIYGIVSCSILFAFIEFLSAWFLKQYRQFVDTSTYLIKVKSIFDKFLLAYLAAREFNESDSSNDKYRLALMEMIKADMAWPESYLTKCMDVGFAKEAIDSMTNFLSALKNNKSDKL